jgi:RNA polymerase sigma-70 factor (ECF subfamily)
MERAEIAAVEARIREGLAGGDSDAAVTAAIRGYGPQILAYLDRIVGDPSDADDVFATFCEDMWRGASLFRGESTFLTWAYRLAWHAAARFLRDPYRRRGRALHTGEAARLAAEVRSTTALHLRQTGKDALAELRASLDPEEQTLLVLRVDRGLAWEEIAHVLADGDAAPSTAALRKRFERLKEKLRNDARARGLLPE